MPTFDERIAALVSQDEFSEAYQEAVADLRDAHEVRARANLEHVRCAENMGRLTFIRRSSDQQVEYAQAIGATKIVRRILGREDD